MKKMTALALALVMLLSCTAAFADRWPGAQVGLNHMNVRLVGSDNQQKVALKGMRLYVRMGVAEGLPTLQLVLKYGDNQRLDCVFRQKDSRLMIYSGGIAGVYYIDLEELMDQPGEGAQAAAAFGEALAMFGEDPTGVIENQMPEDEDGNHALTLELSPAACSKLLSRLQGLTEDDEALENDIGGAIAQLEASDDPIEIRITYNTKKDQARVYFLRGEKGARLYGRTTLKTGDISFTSIGDEVEYDLLNMDQDTRDDLLGEIGFMAIKVGAFLKHSSLKHLSD